MRQFAALRAQIARRVLPVGRGWRIGISGLVWSAVGVMLLRYAAGWLAPVALPLEIVLAAAGLAAAAAAARFMFAGIVRRNIERIQRGPDRASVLAFQAWRSWVMTAGMVALGIVLRHSPVPRPALAVVYETIGGALLLASLVYHRALLASVRVRG